jgi:ATP-dependent RNA helicase DeaD
MTASLATAAEPPSFDALSLSAEVRRAVDDLGYRVPTPVQLAVYEPAKRGSDLVVQARTGTGKTAAFGLPLVDGLVRKKAVGTSTGPQAVVLCPTRELALQVAREITALGVHTGLSVCSVYGGAAMSPQIEALKQGPQIIVGTPGRVLDHIARGTLDVKGVRVFVLDESDEMLSMGFLPQIDKIWSELPKSIQVLLFSATVPREVLRIADSRLKQPQFITLSGDHIGALEINHFVYISQGNKHDELLQLLEIENPESAIIFCNTRDETKQVAGVLQAHGYNADWLNADLPQNEREAVMKRTREGMLRFLVCTDVAARGIDISHLTHVINFDFPESTEQYVHRTGRTGRAGRTGTAIALVAPGELGNLYILRLQYKIRPVEKQLPSALEVRTRAETDVLQQLAEQMRDAPSAEVQALARRLLTHDDAERLIAGLLQGHLAAHHEPWLSAQQARRGRLPAPVPVVAAARDRKHGATSRTATARATASQTSHSTSAGTAEPSPRQAKDTKETAAGHDKPIARERSKSTSSESRSAGKERREGSKTARERHPAHERSMRDHSLHDHSLHEEHGIRYQVSDADANPAEAAATPATTASSAALKEVYVNAGTQDGVNADELRALLVQQGFSADDIKRITVRFRNSFIQVPAAALSQALAALNGQTLHERALVAEESRGKSSPRR